MSFLVVILDVFIFEGEDAHEDDEEEDVTEGEDVVAGLVAAGRPQTQPLQGHHQLDQDGEEEEERLVHGGEVDPGVEGDEEDQLDQERGVDEDVREAGADPDSYTGGVSPLESVGEAKGGAE